MQIKAIEFENFRNYENFKIEFSSGVSVIYGENGQGKTNILEAVYMCGLGKSHRKSRDEEMILFGKEEAHIKGEFEISNLSKRIDIHLKKNSGKGIAVNQIPIKKISELYGQISVVIFSPEDLEIIKRGPSVRRNFMNVELCQMDPIYTENLISYTKIMKQRNELLKEIESNKNKAEELKSTLDIWDIQLSNYGKEIIHTRKKYTDELNKIIEEIHADISGGKEKLRAVYEPSSGEDDFYENLLRARKKDEIYKNTSVGPHRDDMSFTINGQDLKSYGSQGQQRTCALSLKLAEIEIIEKRKKEKPILLLDDVLSELDRKRQKELLKRISSMQTIITCTGMDEFIENEAQVSGKYYIKDAKLI